MPATTFSCNVSVAANTKLVALGIVEQQRQRFGLGEALQAAENDAQDLGQLERRGERANRARSPRVARVALAHRCARRRRGQPSTLELPEICASFSAA